MNLELTVIAVTTIILTVAALLTAICRRASAAARHTIWAIALGAALTFPFASMILPKFELPVLPQEPIANFATNNVRSESTAVDDRRSLFITPTEPADQLSTPRAEVLPVPATNWTWRQWLATAWGLGSLVILLRALMGIWEVRNLRRRSAKVSDDEMLRILSESAEALGVSRRVELRIGDHDLPPMTWGFFRNVILLPATAGEWSGERLRVTLAHELAHIQRRDGLIQIFVQSACSLYWFNPAVWYAAHCLRIERERACDDRVLLLGTEAEDYAEHLLQIARGMRSNLSFATVSMAHPSQLETRVVAILDSRTRRRALSKLATSVLFALVAVATLSAAAIQLTALAPIVLPVAVPPPPPPTPESVALEPASPAPQTDTSTPSNLPGKLEGVILNDAGRPLPSVRVQLEEKRTSTDMEGRFVFEEIPPGTHRLLAEKDGYLRARPENGTQAGSSGIGVTVTPGPQPTTIALRMSPAGSVIGRIVDANGQPLRTRMTVAPYRYVYNSLGNRVLTRVGGNKTVSREEAVPFIFGVAYQTPVDSRFDNVVRANTDDRGEFRIFNLEPGEYTFYIAPFTFTPSGPSPVFYPGVTDPAGAKLVNVVGGQETQLGQITMSAGTEAALRVKLANNSGGATGAVVARLKGMPEATRSAGFSSGDIYDLGRLPSGVYDVEAYFGKGTSPFGGAAHTSVSLQGQDATIELTVPPATSVTGRAETSAPNPRPVAGVQLAFGSQETFPALVFPITSGDDGSLTGNMPAGLFYLTKTSGIPANLCLAQVRQGERNVLKDGIDIERGQSALSVTLSASHPLRGTATDADGKRAPGAFVVLLPADRARIDLYQTTAADQNGAFEFRCTAAGDYRLFAWPELDGAAYRNPEFMKRYDARGTAVRITETIAPIMTLKVLEP